MKPARRATNISDSEGDQTVEDLGCPRDTEAGVISASAGSETRDLGRDRRGSEGGETGQIRLFDAE
jgi:hypothetical protein